MDLEHLFNGSALNAVDAKGRLSIPAFIRSVVERRSDAKAVVIGLHEVDPCLTAYDRGYSRYLQTEIERRRLAEEKPGDAAGHFARARRVFGLPRTSPTIRAAAHPPPMMAEGQIEELALFVASAARSKS